MEASKGNPKEQSHAASAAILPENWNAACCAYNLYYIPPIEVRSSLHQAAQRLRQIETRMLVVPEHALHTSVGWILPVRFTRLAQYRARWVSDRGHVTRVVGREIEKTPVIDIHYTRMMWTPTAVIAIAEPAEPVNELRDRIAQQLALPTPFARGRLVHTTLCRYSTPPTDTTRLARLVDSVLLCQDTTIHELSIVEETRFPSLSYSVVQRYKLDGRE